MKSFSNCLIMSTHPTVSTSYGQFIDITHTLHIEKTINQSTGVTVWNGISCLTLAIPVI